MRTWTLLRALASLTAVVAGTVLPLGCGWLWGSAPMVRTSRWQTGPVPTVPPDPRSLRQDEFGFYHPPDGYDWKNADPAHPFDPRRAGQDLEIRKVRPFDPKTAPFGSAGRIVVLPATTVASRPAQPPSSITVLPATTIASGPAQPPQGGPLAPAGTLRGTGGQTVPLYPQSYNLSGTWRGTTQQGRDYTVSVTHSGNSISWTTPSGPSDIQGATASGTINGTGITANVTSPSGARFSAEGAIYSNTRIDWSTGGRWTR